MSGSEAGPGHSDPGPNAPAKLPCTEAPDPPAAATPTVIVTATESQVPTESTPPAPATPQLELEKTENDSDSSSASSSDSSSDNEGEPLIPAAAGEVIRFESGAHAVQGVRPTMEDAHVISEASHSIGVCCIYAIYDGHGGSRVAKLAAEKLHEYVIADPSFNEGKVEEAMRAAYKRMDHFILERATAEKWKDGSTGVLLLVHGKKLYVSNVGDSEAVLGRRNSTGSAFEPVLLTEKHLPTVQSEKSRIEGMGGFVFKGRVFGTLAVSRALGDCSFKNPNFVSADPSVRTLDLSPDDRFLVVACDGLWDKITYAEAVQMVGEQRRAGLNATAIADFLTREALRRQSLDNVSAIVVFFQWE